MKKSEKYSIAIALNVLYAKKEKYILLMFQNITQAQTQVFLLMTSNGEKQWHYFTLKNFQHYLEEQHQRKMVILLSELSSFF